MRKVFLLAPLLINLVSGAQFFDFTAFVGGINSLVRRSHEFSPQIKETLETLSSTANGDKRSGEQKNLAKYGEIDLFLDAYLKNRTQPNFDKFIASIFEQLPHLNLPCTQPNERRIFLQQVTDAQKESIKQKHKELRELYDALNKEDHINYASHLMQDFPKILDLCTNLKKTEELSKCVDDFLTIQLRARTDFDKAANLEAHQKVEERLSKLISRPVYVHPFRSFWNSIRKDYSDHPHEIQEALEKLGQNYDRAYNIFESIIGLQSTFDEYVRIKEKYTSVEKSFTECDRQFLQKHQDYLIDSQSLQLPQTTSLEAINSSIRLLTELKSLQAERSLKEKEFIKLKKAFKETSSKLISLLNEGELLEIFPECKAFIRAKQAGEVISQDLSKRYLGLSLTLYLQESPHYSPVASYGMKDLEISTLPEDVRHSSLNLPSYITITPRFFKLLSILKELGMSDLKDAYWAHPTLFTWLGFNPSEPKLSLSEALSKYCLGENWVQPDSNRSYGEFKGRRATHFINLEMALEKAKGGDKVRDLQIILEKYRTEQSLNPLERKIIDLYNIWFEKDEKVGICPAHAMPTSVRFLSYLADSIRRYFPHLITHGSYQQNPENLMSRDRGSSAMTCAVGRGNEDALVAVHAAAPAAATAISRRLTTWTYNPKPGDEYLNAVVVNPRTDAQKIDNYRNISILIRGVPKTICAALFMISVNFTPMNSHQVSGSHTMGFMAARSSIRPPNFMNEVQSTFTSMGITLSKNQEEMIENFSNEFSRTLPENTLATLHFSQERSDQIVYLCMPLGRAIFPDIEDCRPHRFTFFRHLMGLIDPSNSKWLRIQNLIKADIFGGNDPLSIQGRVIVHKDLFRTQAGHVAKEYTYGGDLTPEGLDRKEVDVILFLERLLENDARNISGSLKIFYDAMKRSKE